MYIYRIVTDFTELFKFKKFTGSYVHFYGIVTGLCKLWDINRIICLYLQDSYRIV